MKIKQITTLLLTLLICQIGLGNYLSEIDSQITKGITNSSETLKAFTPFAEDLFISEYVEGSSYNKALEIFNGTGHPVNLSDYKVQIFSNGAQNPGANINLNGILNNGDVFVIAHISASPDILKITNLSNGSLSFNGDDAITLTKISTNSYVDIFGVIGNDPGNAWIGPNGYSTLDKTLVRNPEVCHGVTINPSGTGPNAFTTLTTEWTLFDRDTFTNLGFHLFTGNNTEVDPPTIQTSNITGYPGVTSMTLEWTPGNGSRRIVKMNTVNSFTDPLDGSYPVANPIWANSGEQVIYNGSTQIVEDTPFNGCEVTNLNPSTTYWFRAYEYNGTGSNTKYLTTTATGNPATLTTLEGQGSGYYAGIDGYGANLKQQLHTLIKDTHTTKYSYAALITQIPYTDEDPDNSDNLIEIYTGWSVNKNNFGNAITDWNREHTWSKSHGNFGDTPPAGTDLHHLRPCDSTLNSTKGNKDFAEGGNPVIDNSPPAGYTGETGCFQTTYSWEPRNDDKGDVARMIMYMAVRYEGNDPNFQTNLEMVDYIHSDENTNQPYYGKLSTLLQWHIIDPPDEREMQRNNRIAERQGNRNPFIDHPEYATRIWTPCPIANTNVTETSFTANWSQPIQATAYYFQLASDSLFINVLPGYNNLNVQLTTSKTITGLNNGSTYYYRLCSFFLEGYGMWSPFMSVTLTSPEPITATLSSSFPLDEYNLNGASLTLVLTGTTFTDNNLLISNFTLNNAPAGLSIQSVNYINPTTAIVTLNFNGLDFDINYYNVSITIAAEETLAHQEIITNSITIYALIEGRALLSLEQEGYKLTIVPVIDASAYRIFGSTNPYGFYSEITSSGNFEFEVPYNNIWHISFQALPEDRYFFKVAAMRQ